MPYHTGENGSQKQCKKNNKALPPPHKKREKRPFTWRKGPQLEGEKAPWNRNCFLCWRGVCLLSPPPCGCIWANVIIKCTIFSEITHPMIISKYTLECISLNYFLKFSRKIILSNPLAIKLNRVIRTAPSTTQARCITIPPHYLKNYIPHVWTWIFSREQSCHAYCGFQSFSGAIIYAWINLD